LHGVHDIVCLPYSKNPRAIHQEELFIGEKHPLPEVSTIYITRKIFTRGSIKINFLHLFSDGASAHFKNNASILNLIHRKTDFGLDACWILTATVHGKGVGDVVGAVLKLDVPHSRRTFFYLRRRISMSSQDNINLK
jgi:hypothetical protein